MPDDDDVVLEEDAPRLRPRLNLNIFNLLSALVGMLTLFSCLCAFAIFIFPSAPYNPFPPPTVTQTPTITPTATNTPRPPTRTPQPTGTKPATATRLIVPTAGGFAATPAPAALFSAEITASRPLPKNTCEDIAFAGEVKDAQGGPLLGYTVEVARADGFRASAVSGTKTDYGASGWEIPLVNAQGTPEPIHVSYSVRLLNPDGAAVGPEIPAERTMTSNNCNEALIYIVFRQTQ